MSNQIVALSNSPQIAISSHLRQPVERMFPMNVLGGIPCQRHQDIRQEVSRRVLCLYQLVNKDFHRRASHRGHIPTSLSQSPDIVWDHHCVRGMVSLLDPPLDPCIANVIVRTDTLVEELGHSQMRSRVIESARLCMLTSTQTHPKAHTSEADVEGLI